MQTAIIKRIAGINKVLLAAYEAGIPFSNASKGVEREAFISEFLEKIYPASYRFGTGDAIDRYANKSGQLDVVIEQPFGPSIPLGNGKTRLYLAETIGAVIEVKSNIVSQWADAVSTAEKLAKVVPNHGATMSMGKTFNLIPLFVVGYGGWKKIETLQQHLSESPSITGVLIIDEKPLFATALQPLGNIAKEGPEALWAFICCLQEALSSLKAAHPDFLAYAKQTATLEGYITFDPNEDKTQ